MSEAAQHFVNKLKIGFNDENNVSISNKHPQLLVEDFEAYISGCVYYLMRNRIGNTNIYVGF